MRTRLWVAVVMFILLAISTSFLGGYIAYRNYQLDTSGEISDICGYVIDEEGRPVRGVMVGLDEKTTFTNESGRFLMEEVNVGIITIEFYKAGYVPVEATRLVYPKEDIDGKLEDSVNNISSGEDIILYEEMVVAPYGNSAVKNGSLTINVNTFGFDSLAGRMIGIGNGTGQMTNHTIENGSNSYEIRGNGTIALAAGSMENISIWHFIPGKELNITPWVASLFGIARGFEPPTGRMDIMLELPDDVEDLSLGVLDPLYGFIEVSMDGLSEGQALYLNVTSGIVSIVITGRDVLDITYSDIVVEDGTSVQIELELEKATVSRLQEGLTLGWNYLLAGTYLLVGAAFALGAYLTRRGSKWTFPLIIAFLGFLVRGIYLGPLNLNLILATSIVLILFFSREDFERRKNG